MKFVEWLRDIKIVNKTGNRLGLFVVGIHWPDPSRPFWIWFEILFDQFAVGIHWNEFTTPKGRQYWSRGLVLGMFEIRVSRDK